LAETAAADVFDTRSGAPASATISVMTRTRCRATEVPLTSFPVPFVWNLIAFAPTTNVTEPSGLKKLNVSDSRGKEIYAKFIQVQLMAVALRFEVAKTAGGHPSTPPRCGQLPVWVRTAP
jgi:hypothetical protein